MTMNDSRPPKPKRRRDRLGLRRLLLGVLLVLVIAGLAVCWVDARVQRAKLNREAPAAIRKVEAEIARSLGRRRPESPMPRISVWHRQPGWIEARFDDPGTPLCSLDAKGSRFGDSEMAYLKRLAGLQELDLIGTEVTDAGLAHLQGLTGLRQLILDGTAVTDAGLEHLEGLTNLGRLDLLRTRVTGAGLEHLKGLRNLQWLLLGEMQCTDEGLEHLKGLGNLQELHLRGPRVSSEGIERLRQALPNCTIYHQATAAVDASPYAA